MIQAIETLYAGCRFRSRLEARWAVFFDHLGIEWQYEPEGFELRHGRRYLPDFRLTGGVRAPRPVGDRIGVVAAMPTPCPLWVEIKGSHPSDEEVLLAAEFARDGHGRFVFLIGDIPRESVVGDLWCAELGSFIPCHFFQGEPLQDALTAARSARFEYGETP